MKAVCNPTRAMLLATVLLLAGSAFAANKGHMQLLSPATLGGTQLAAGDYSVQWEGTGEQVQLKIFQGKQSVASTSAHVMKLERPVPTDSVMVIQNNDGSRSVSRINFSKKDFALGIDNEGGAGAAGAGAAR